MFALASSTGTSQETEIREKLTASFYWTNNEMSWGSKDDHISQIHVVAQLWTGRAGGCGGVTSSNSHL